jgi:DNA (cytosine-5)-methyltransferase 1
MRRGDRPQSGEQELSTPSGLGPTTVALVHSASKGLEGHGQSGCVAEGGVGQTGIVVSGEGCGTSDKNFWSDAVWLTGSDGKARRAKPGLPLLAHGVSNRVGRLRAYGNAIVPPLAAEVIRAFMECEP